MKEPDIELALIRWAVVCLSWNEIGGTFPSFTGFMAGWCSRICECPEPAFVGKYRDSFRRGWAEADGQIAIANRVGGRP